jgi:Tfp pilus assembly protein PilW
MKISPRMKSEKGFSLAELMVSMCILIPAMGAAVSLFSVGANQHATEQSSIDANQEARSAFEMMTTEIAQAASHGDRTTTLSVPINTPSTAAQDATVDSTTGFTVGDYVEVVDPSGDRESVQLTAVGTGTLTGVFRATHPSGASVRLFAVPYPTGLITPAGMAANSSTTVTTIRFFGNIIGDNTVQYVEYAYDATSNQITRSITPVAQATRNEAVVFVRNVKPGSVQFTLSTDARAVATSAGIAMTVMNTVKSGSNYQETQLASRISIPSAIAASVLLDENQRFGGFNRLPPTPPKVAAWTSQ